jgi:hypothetical protein
VTVWVSTSTWHHHQHAPAPEPKLSTTECINTANCTHSNGSFGT